MMRVPLLPAFGFGSNHRLCRAGTPGTTPGTGVLSNQQAATIPSYSKQREAWQMRHVIHTSEPKKRRNADWRAIFAPASSEIGIRTALPRT